MGNCIKFKVFHVQVFKRSILCASSIYREWVCWVSKSKPILRRPYFRFISQKILLLVPLPQTMVDSLPGPSPDGSPQLDLDVDFNEDARLNLFKLGTGPYW